MDRLSANVAGSLGKEPGGLGSVGGTTDREIALEARDLASDPYRLAASAEHEARARSAARGVRGFAKHERDDLPALVEWLGKLSTATHPRPGPVSPDHPTVLGWREPVCLAHRVAPSAGSLAYHHATRALVLCSRYLDRAATCGEEVVCGTVDLGCNGCGEVYPIMVGCGLKSWCIDCSRKYRSSVKKRLTKGLGNAQRYALRQWREAGKPRGERPELTLVTLTVRHSGDLRADRRTIMQGLRGLQKRLWHVDGGAAPYVAAWELTPGLDGLGHVHCHVAAVWPRRDLRALDAAWAELTDGAGTTVDVVGPGKAARAARARGETRSASDGAKGAAYYLAAYVDAGGMSGDVPPAMAAEWLAAMRGQRAWHASAGLETKKEPLPWTPCCADFATCIGFHRLPRDRFECSATDPPNGPETGP